MKKLVIIMAGVLLLAGCVPYYGRDGYYGGYYGRYGNGYGRYNDRYGADDGYYGRDDRTYGSRQYNPYTRGGRSQYYNGGRQDRY
jgi:hypothetical protein